MSPSPSIDITEQFPQVDAALRALMKPSLLGYITETPGLIVCGSALIRPLVDKPIHEVDLFQTLLPGVPGPETLVKDLTGLPGITPAAPKSADTERPASALLSDKLHAYSRGTVYERRIYTLDVVWTVRTAREILDGFDVNLLRVCWRPDTGLQAADDSVVEDLERRHVVMRRTPWNRPHREAKYRRLLDDHRTDGVVLPWVGMPGVKNEDPRYRPMSVEEVEALRGAAPRLDVPVAGSGGDLEPLGGAQ